MSFQPVAGRYKFRRVSEVGRLVDEVLCPLGEVVLVLVTIVAEQLECPACHIFSALLMFEVTEGPARRKELRRESEALMPCSLVAPLPGRRGGEFGEPRRHAQQCQDGVCSSKCLERKVRTRARPHSRAWGTWDGRFLRTQLVSSENLTRNWLVRGAH